MAEASVRLHHALVAAIVSSLAACSGSPDSSSAFAAVPADGEAATSTVVASPPIAERRTGEDSIFRGAAKAAWRFANRNYVAATGLTKPFDTYAMATMWDVASGLAAMFSAAELGLLDRAEYERRMQRALQTLERIPLFNGVGF